MAIKVKDSFITEDIEDQDGKKIGEIRFNPNDSRIMSKLTKIVNDLGNTLEELKSMGDIQPIPQEKLETVEDFEKVSDTFKTIERGFAIEETAVDNVIQDLSEVFGEDTINIFTHGTKDLMSLMPLIEFVLPYVKEARQSKVEKYIKNNEITPNSELDVME